MANLPKSSGGVVIEFRDVSYRLADGGNILSNINLQVRSGEGRPELGQAQPAS